MTGGVRPSRVSSEESICVMYSGGLDSTAAAIDVCRRFRRVVLLTVDFPFTVGLANAARNVRGLQNAFPRIEITHHVVDGRRSRRSIWGGFPGDYFEFCHGCGAGIVCLGCKMAMMVEAVRHSLEHGIGQIANGMTRAQSNHPDCMPSVVNRFGDFMADYGIAYINPVYDVETRRMEMDALRDAGLSQGVIVGASSITHQPRCFFGPFTKLWLEYSPVAEAGMAAYFDGKKAVMRHLVGPALAGRSGKGRMALRTRIDETVKVSPVKEFGPGADRGLALCLAPVWWISKVLFWIRKLS